MNPFYFLGPWSVNFVLEVGKISSRRIESCSKKTRRRIEAGQMSD